MNDASILPLFRSGLEELIGSNVGAEVVRVYVTLLDSLQSGFILFDSDWTILFCNKMAASILGVEKDDVAGKSPSVFMGTFSREDGTRITREDEAISSALRAGRAVEEEILGVGGPDGVVRRWISVSVTPFMRMGALDKIVASFNDVTRLKSMMESLRRSEEDLKSILDHTPVGVCITDQDGVFEQVNDAYCKLYGYPREDLVGKHFTMVVPPENKEYLSRLHDQFIRDGTEIRGEWEVMDRSGQRKVILADAARIAASDGRRARKATFVVDITDKIRYEKEIEEKNRLLGEQNRVDALTGLHNRKHAMERLQEFVEMYNRYGTSFCVAMLDIDHFKAVNDTFGHQAGDEVLVVVAGVLGKLSREVDMVARYGGEEFLLAMPHTALSGAVAAMEKIRTSINALEMTSRRIRVSVSAGVAGYSGQGVSRCIEEADKALYLAKSGGRDRVVSA